MVFNSKRAAGIFPRLLQALPEQHQAFVISGCGLGLHWDELDEDISVPALLAGQRDMTGARKRVAGGWGTSA